MFHFGLLFTALLVSHVMIAFVSKASLLFFFSFLSLPSRFKLAVGRLCMCTLLRAYLGHAARAFVHMSSLSDLARWKHGRERRSLLKRHPVLVRRNAIDRMRSVYSVFLLLPVASIVGCDACIALCMNSQVLGTTNGWQGQMTPKPIAQLTSLTLISLHPG